MVVVVVVTGFLRVAVVIILDVPELSVQCLMKVVMKVVLMLVVVVMLLVMVVLVVMVVV